MHELRQRSEFIDRTKQLLLRGCNPALLALLLGTTLFVGAQPLQEAAQATIQRSELLSYEGEKISSVELAGQPDQNVDEVMSMLAIRSGDDFSASKIEQTLETLRRMGKFTEVQLELRPEQ